MKDRKTKEKKHESTIGKIIYGFLLFMPLLAIGVTSLVSTFNMSAKEETEITYKYQTNEVNSADDLVNGNYYKFDTRLFNQIGNEQSLIPLEEDFIFFYDIYFYSDNRDISSPNLHTSGSMDYDFASPVYACGYQIKNLGQGNISVLIGMFDVYCGLEGYDLYFEVESENQYYIYSKIYFNRNSQFLNNVWTCFSECPSDFLPIESVVTHNLDTQDVFYRAIDKVQQSPLFNWAENSIIYTGMNNFTTSLSITTPFIPLLMTYWLIISVVYFLYDIVLIILVVLHRKIHCLEESI